MEILRSRHRAHLRAARFKVKQKDRLPRTAMPGEAVNEARVVYSIVNAMMLLPRLESI